MLRRCTFLILFLFVCPTFATPFNAIVPLKDKGAKTFYVKGKLGDLEYTEFMIDTGSGYMAINQTSLNRLKETGQALYVKDIKGILANGEQLIVPVWRVQSITIHEACVIHDVEVAVFPGKTRQILGLTALKKAAPFTLSFDPPQITLSHCLGNAT